MKKIFIIIKAYFNLLKEQISLLNPIKRKLFNSRLEICFNCEFKSVDNKKCSLCGCPLKPKTRGDYDMDENNLSIFGCPKKYW